jgi:uncharacterized protein
MGKKKNINRRDFFKELGIGALTTATTMAATSPLLGFVSDENEDNPQTQEGTEAQGMTYRVNRHTGDKVSLLGYGCMRWPSKPGTRELDQDKINTLIDYAMAHGVNYYDTAPAYGNSEIALGNAIHKYPRDKYFIATKLSNFQSSGDALTYAQNMYNESKRRLKIDYIDYYLLHAVGKGVENFKSRFVNNGVLDYFLKERQAGHIRNLGFSFHGDKEVFDYLLANYKWDFVQIELNYVEWKHAHDINPHNANMDYYYDELEKHGIQAVIMEPLLGGRLAKLSDNLTKRLKDKRPNDSIASWGFRYAGSLPNVLTVLSGMGQMEFLEDNVRTYSPLDPCSQAELALLEDIAVAYAGFPMIPCTGCHYCMPCPFGVDIPANFAYYNKCVNEHKLPTDSSAANYKEMAKAFIDGYENAVPEKLRAVHCASCNHCVPLCPQHIHIPDQMKRISKMIDDMKKALV